MIELVKRLHALTEVQKAKAFVKSPNVLRTPARSSRPNRREINWWIDPISYSVLSTNPFLAKGEMMIAGLTGLLSTPTPMIDSMGWWVLAVLAGGYIGAEFGSHRFSPSTIQKLLAGTLLIAGVKLLSSIL